ncbi:MULTISPECIES: YjgN family protein [Flammeovirga]|uniref:DUF898 domain-containing protein n=1 Tax=Flammeovirga agarivorans TaxID=2726742 RepID=A0A7X8SNT1_9BACT|nr:MULTISPECIES: YjgN family protein [Flammeovirga]NLR93563.1 DUF898 domain-containing protein [Flammeovirga agarivorans]
MQNTKTRLQFRGSGSEYFGIEIVNYFLTGITLGMYYPWAKAKKLKYLYGSTSLQNERFTFHGTGKEMFKGFIKVVALMIAFYVGMVGLAMTGDSTLLAIGIGVFYIGLFLLIPIAIHGSLRYRLSRTSLKSIHFGYRGEVGELIKKYFKGLFLSLITLNFYAPWFIVELRKYIIGNIRYGDVEMKFTGKGEELFKIYLKGLILTMITFGIYGFWFQAAVLRYEYEHMKVVQNGKELDMDLDVTGGELFGLILVNLLIVMFTFGLGAPFVTIRTMKFIAERITIIGELDLDIVQQTEEDYKDATGEDMLDALEIEL